MDPTWLDHHASYHSPLHRLRRNISNYPWPATVVFLHARVFGDILLRLGKFAAHGLGQLCEYGGDVSEGPRVAA